MPDVLTLSRSVQEPSLIRSQREGRIYMEGALRGHPAGQQ